MQNKWSAFFDQNYDVPEVKFALKSVKILTETKKRFLKHLSFGAEPAEYGKALSAYSLDIPREGEKSG
tara:strand:- start:97 stop:300 length:204 start_codon:yes stop_codon:yes gene_type:complete